MEVTDELGGVFIIHDTENTAGYILSLTGYILSGRAKASQASSLFSLTVSGRRDQKFATSGSIFKYTPHSWPPSTHPLSLDRTAQEHRPL